MNYNISLADCVLSLELKWEETSNYFSRFSSCDPGYPIGSIPEEAWNIWFSIGKNYDALGEYSLLSMPVSDALLTKRRCVLHGAAFSFHGKSFVICALPGVGKTTILRHLIQLDPSVSVISGDRPVVALEEDVVWLHPSPWNGKEDWYGAPAAPMGALVFLKRADENRVDSLAPVQAVGPVLPSLVCSFETEELIQQCAAFADELLNRVPAVSLLDLDPDGAARALLHYLKEVTES